MPNIGSPAAGSPADPRRQSSYDWGVSDDAPREIPVISKRLGLSEFTARRMVEEHIVSGGRLAMPAEVTDVAKIIERHRISPGSLAHLNDYSPTHWRPRGPRVDDVSQFERAVAEVVAGVGAGAVVSYQWVATQAGYPTRAKAIAEFLARNGEGLPWWRVVSGRGCLTHPQVEEQAQALRREGGVVVGRRLREPRPVAASPGSRPSNGR